MFNEHLWHRFEWNLQNFIFFFITLWILIHFRPKLRLNSTLKRVCSHSASFMFSTLWPHLHPLPRVQGWCQGWVRPWICQHGCHKCLNLKPQTGSQRIEIRSSCFLGCSLYSDISQICTNQLWITNILLKIYFLYLLVNHSCFLPDLLRFFTQFIHHKGFKDLNRVKEQLRSTKFVPF